MPLRRIVLPLLALLMALCACAQRENLSPLRRTVRGWSDFDTAYIEPQHYNWALMLQTTWQYDYYKFRSANGQTFALAPDIRTKIGPFFGWRWLFLGYTFDIHNATIDSHGKMEIDLSLYSQRIGLDLYYKHTGSDYRVHDVDLGKDIDTRALNNVPFDGVKATMKGAHIYYIFNNNHFSYPAAFSQSTVQKISAGSLLAGIGFTSNSLTLDHNKLQQVVDQRLGDLSVPVDSGLRFNEVKYYDIMFSVGYGYNWVFAPRWLLAASGSTSIAFKHSSSNVADNFAGSFSIDNLNFDLIARMALVYNNNRIFAGMSAIAKTNNLHRKAFSANEFFGSINVYAGFNFGARGKYKKKRKR